MSSSPTSAIVQIAMPQMGVSVAEGTILEWHKRPGDWIEADEIVCEITTDKIDVEIPSPASGRLARQLAEPGTTVAVGEPIAEIDPGARPGEVHPEEEAARAETTAEIDRSGFHSPVVRRIAAAHRVDLGEVEGSGVGGRIRKPDLLAFIERNGGAERPQPPLHSESPYQPDEAPAGGGRRTAMSEMRKAIAHRMVESRRTAAHCTTIVEADFSRVVARRAELRETMERRGVKLTQLAFVARATVEALKQFPRLNASIDDDVIVDHDDVNLGIAVAIDEGLIVPVIQRAQRLSLEGLAVEIAALADRAREGRLEPGDVGGGTFTITNPGQFGALLATPIINQPQVAILDVEAIVKRPVVLTDANGEDTIAIRPIGNLCMSWDHRALDGVEAARFLASIRTRLESPETER